MIVGGRVTPKWVKAAAPWRLSFDPYQNPLGVPEGVPKKKKKVRRPMGSRKPYWFGVPINVPNPVAKGYHRTRGVGVCPSDMGALTANPELCHIAARPLQLSVNLSSRKLGLMSSVRPGRTRTQDLRPKASRNALDLQAF